MNKQLLTEAQLTRQYLEDLGKVKSKLIEAGYTEYEADYFTQLHSQLRLNDLFERTFFKEFNYKGTLVNFNDIAFFISRPNFFIDVMTYVFHSKGFLSLFDLDVVGDTLEVKPKKAEEDKEEPTVKNPIKLPNYLQTNVVAEDDNWFTIRMPTYKIADSLRFPYELLWPAKEYPEENQLVKSERVFQPGHCILSGSGYFTSQKPSGGGTWYFTLTKKRPSELIEIRDKQNLDRQVFGNSYLGEIYCASSQNLQGDYGNRLNSWSNTRVSLSTGTYLVPRPSYDYETFSTRKSLEIEGDTLVSIYSPDETLYIPEGVVVIARGAIRNLNNVKKIVLPASTTTIKRGAIIDLPNLRLIAATNNLRNIETNAFTIYNVNNDIVLIGVVEQTNEGTKIKAPKKLRYVPNRLVQVYNSQGYEIEGLTTPAVTDRKVSMEFKPTPYTKEGPFIIEDGILTRVTREIGEPPYEGILNIPEGVTGFLANGVDSPMVALQYIKEIVTPETFISLKNFIQSRFLTKIDLSNSTQIEVLPKKVFAYNLALREVILPSSIKHINSEAFDKAVNLNTLEIPGDNLETIGKMAFEGNFNLNNIVTNNPEKVAYLLVKAGHKSIVEHSNLKEYLEEATKRYNQEQVVT